MNRILITLLPVILLFGCSQKEPHRILLEISQIKPALYDTWEYGVTYDDPALEPSKDGELPPGEDAVHLKQGHIVMDDVLYPNGRAFEKWEYLTIMVDKEKSYLPTPYVSKTIGTITNSPDKIHLRGPIKLPLYVTLRTYGGLDDGSYWIIDKGIYNVGDKEFEITIDKNRLRRPNKTVQTTDASASVSDG